jgi:hypothetical protein
MSVGQIHTSKEAPSEFFDTLEVTVARFQANTTFYQDSLFQKLVSGNFSNFEVEGRESLTKRRIGICKALRNGSSLNSRNFLGFDISFLEIPLGRKDFDFELSQSDVGLLVYLSKPLIGTIQIALQLSHLGKEIQSSDPIYLRRIQLPCIVVS